jgi:hypothetical protein
MNRRYRNAPSAESRNYLIAPVRIVDIIKGARLFLQKKNNGISPEMDFRSECLGQEERQSIVF